MLGAVARESQMSRASIPITIAITKTTTRGDSVAKLAMAGPGHRPTRPQPRPNSTAPARSGAANAKRLVPRMVGRRKPSPMPRKLPSRTKLEK